MRAASPLLSIGCLGLLILALSGCASPKRPPAPQVVEAPPATDYLVGPADALNVIVWRNPEVSGTFPVLPDGKLTTPLVEDLPVAGRTPTQVARDIEQALSKYIQDPVVTVIVSTILGTYSQQVRVIGEATKPASMLYRDKMSLMDVLISVGGITEFADGNRATIQRGGPGGQLLGVRLDDLLRDGDLSANVEMYPGDVLVIPESWF